MKQYKFNVEPLVEADKSIAKIILEGELTLNSASEIKDDLLHTLKKYDGLQIIVQKVGNIDLSCIQLLHATKKSCLNLNKRFSVKLDLPDDLKTLADNAGFTDDGF